jgi:type II secretion system protein G
MNIFSQKHTNKGFTLIELLVVISIIALLSTVVLSSLTTARKKARDVQRKAIVKQIQNALELYRNDNGGLYPATGGAGCTNMNISWSTSMEPTCWSNFATLLQNYISSLPIDPIQTYTSIGPTGGPDRTGNFGFAIYTGPTGTSWGCASRNFYLIIYRNELAAGNTSIGCDGSTVNYNTPAPVTQISSFR